MSTGQFCVRHPERSGIGLCMGCGRVVCEECGGREEGILRCRRCLSVRVREASPESRARRLLGVLLGALATLSALSLLAVFFFQFLRIAALWRN